MYTHIYSWRKARTVDSCIGKLTKINQLENEKWVNVYPGLDSYRPVQWNRQQREEIDIKNRKSAMRIKKQEYILFFYVQRVEG